MSLFQLQNAPCGIFLLDQDLRLQEANPALCEILGLTLKAVLGRPLDDFLAPTYRLLFHMQAMTMLHANGWVEEISLSLADARGQEIPVLFNAVRLLNNDAQVIECVVLRVPERRRMEDDLFNIKKAVEHVPGVVFQYLRRADGRASIPYATEGLRTLYGLRPVQVQHSANILHERTHADDMPAFLHSINTSAQTLTPWHLEYRINLPTKGVRWLEGRAMPEARINGDVLWHGYVQDITERKALQSALASEYERMLVTLRSIGDAVISTLADGRVELLNAAAETLTGWSQGRALGQNIGQVFCSVDEHTRAPTKSTVDDCLAQRVVIALEPGALLLACDGTEYAVEGTAAPLLDAHGGVNGAVLVFRNVTAERKQHRAVEHRATHDHLTGLPNRAEYDRVLQQLFESAQDSGAVHALCCIDLDRFKQINDRCGHAAGDQVLRRVAGVLKSCVRTRDTVARLGGDEFALLLENCDLEAASRVAELVCRRVSKLGFEFEEEVLHVGASVGLALINNHWSRAHEVQLAADQACFAAKAAGRGGFKVAGVK